MELRLKRRRNRIQRTQGSNVSPIAVKGKGNLFASSQVHIYTPISIRVGSATARGHIQHILRRLGVRSPAAAGDERLNYNVNHLPARIFDLDTPSVATDEELLLVKPAAPITMGDIDLTDLLEVKSLGNIGVKVSESSSVRKESADEAPNHSTI